MSTIRIKAAVVDTKKLLLYKEDGSTISIPQGDPRIKALVDQIVPIVNAGEIAEIDLKLENQYRDFELAQPSEGGGLVRFFRTARSKLGGLFKTEEDEELPTGVFGEIPVVDNLNTAIEEIIRHAEPVSKTEFTSAEMQSGETMIAVVEDAKGETKIIPGVEALKDILEHSAKHRNTIGVQNLLKRMAGYISERQHSVEDLLRFLEKGDLPIADDGSILAYKRLYTTDKEGVFVDPHTRKVTQKVGSKVQVAEELVDKNRRNECSNGLHIGRRAYMGSFSGNVMVLCKIAPEDVIVVPHNDPNKVRVSAYHILARLPEKAFEQIRQNLPMTNIAGLSELLGKALKGNHIDVLETVEITQQRGEGLIITPTGAVRKLGANRKKDALPAATAIDDQRNLKPKQEASSVDVKDLAKQVGGSRQQIAGNLLSIIETSKDPLHIYQAAVDLVAFKKRVKIGWPVLGLTKDQVAKVLNIATGPKPAQRIHQKSAKTPVKAKAPKKPAKAKTRSTVPQKPSKLVMPPASKVVRNPDTDVGGKLHRETVAAPNQSLTNNQQARIWRDQLDSNHLSDAQHAVIARQMLDSRRRWKKSWAALGLSATTDEELKAIINAAPIDVPHVEPISQHDRSKMRMGHKPKHEDGRLVGRPLNDPMEMSLPSDKKAALALVRSGKTVSTASKETGVHRRTIDRLIEKFGK
jgi:hypothetical protein